jgi:hypothetical protein
MSDPMNRKTIWVLLGQLLSDTTGQALLDSFTLYIFEKRALFILHQKCHVITHKSLVPEDAYYSRLGIIQEITCN